jgi:hypothetical protein
MNLYICGYCKLTAEKGMHRCERQQASVKAIDTIISKIYASQGERYVGKETRVN